MKKYKICSIVVLIMLMVFAVCPGYKTHNRSYLTNYITNCSRELEREMAFEIFRLTEPVLNPKDRNGYEQRLKKLEENYQNIRKNPIFSLARFKTPKKEEDCFGQLVVDIQFKFNNCKELDAALKRKLEELEKIHGLMGCLELEAKDKNHQIPADFQAKIDALRGRFAAIAAER